MVNENVTRNSTTPPKGQFLHVLLASKPDQRVLDHNITNELIVMPLTHFLLWMDNAYEMIIITTMMIPTAWIEYNV